MNKDMDSDIKPSNKRTKHLVLKIYGVIALAILLSMFVIYKSALGGYRLDWTAVSEIEKKGVRVEARFAPRETLFSLILPTPPILSVFVIEPWYNLRWNRELVRIKKGDNKANLTLSDDSVLFISTYKNPRDLFKLYFLTNISRYKHQTLIIDRKDELFYDEPTSFVINERYSATVRNVSNLSNAIKVTLTSLKFEDDVSIETKLIVLEAGTITSKVFAPGYYERNLLVLGADSIIVSLSEPEFVGLTIKWSNGQITEDYCLTNPQENREFMEVCGY